MSSSINGISITSSVFPSQLVSDKEKQSEKWQKDCVDGAINKVLYTQDYMRKKKEEKIDNYLILQGKFQKERIFKHLNPLVLEQYKEDSETYEMFSQEDGYSIILAPLNVLWGEELKRNFDPKAYVVNPDAVSQKEDIINDKIMELINNSFGTEDKQQNEEKVRRFQEWKAKEVQTIHEEMANSVLAHYLPKTNYKTTMNDCFKDLTAVAEEIAYIGSRNNEPYIRKCNPLQIIWYGNGQSNKVEDATVIVEWGYYSLGAIISEFNKTLKKEEINKLENYLNYGSTNSGSLIKTVNTPPYMNLHNVLLPMDDMEQKTPFGYTWYDRQGNILVVRVNWLSERKILEVKYPDEFGDIQTKLMPEFYKVNKALGETATEIYINEWMSGVKIGHDIFTDIKVNPVQYRSMVNPAVCKPPYVGRVANINSGVAFSIVDAIKELAYEYIIFAKKLKHLWLTNLGNVAVIDVASIPSGMMPDGSQWDLQRWFTFIKNHRIALKNSFQEDNAGHLVGNMQQSTNYINMSAAQEITQIINYLQYIEEQINRLSGVSAQRQGDISPSQGLGTSQQAVAYSATQTEVLFVMHEEFKLDVVRMFLEEAKYCLKNTKEIKQRILDDQQIMLMDFDGMIFASADYDIQISNSYKMQDLERLLKTDLLSRALQNGTINISDAIQLLTSNTPQQALSKIKAAEERIRTQQQQNEERKTQLEQQALQLQQQMAKQAQDFEIQKLQFQRETDLMKLELQLKSRADETVFKEYNKDTDKDGVDDQIELDKQKLINENEEKKRNFEAEQKEKDRQLERELAKQDKEIKLSIANMSKNNKTK